MGRKIAIDLKMGASALGITSAVGFVSLPVIEGVVFLSARGYGGSLDEAGGVVLWFLALLHAATIPGLVFGRRLSGTIRIIDEVAGANSSDVDRSQSAPTEDVIGSREWFDAKRGESQSRAPG